MKKYISYLLTLALLVPAFVSCTQERDFLSKKQKTHTVHFATSEPATRTGLSIEENMVKPDWRKTKGANVHFFEIDVNNDVAYGVSEDEISLSSDNRTAHFKAVISEEVVIHIDPSTGEEDNSKGVKSSSRVAPFTFAAVVAQKQKDAYTFVIPSEQHPDAETLKDPDAEFLVGYSRKSYPEQYDYESNVVDLYFDRVAALGRLAISGFVGTGEKVKSVKITATGGMTGKATYPGDFTLGDKNKVNFKKVDEPLVLNYGENGVAAPAKGAFYAYFVAAPGEASVTSIEVLTDQYKYTKTVEGGASFTFSDEQLLNIDFALSADIAEAVTEDNNTWYKASVLEAGYDYLIVSGGQALKNNGGEIDVLAVEPQDGVITFESSTDPTIVWTAKAHVEYYDENDTKPAGHYTLSQGEGDATLYFERYSNKQTQNGSIVSAPTEDTNGNYKYYVWEYDGEHFYQISRDGDDGVYCLTYNSGWKFEYQSKPNTYLYTNRPPVEISFASAEAKYDLDNEEWTVAIPELTAPEGAVVTYSSSDEEIATVAADGTVTPKAVGSAVITATVTGSAEYQGGAASYTLEVTSSNVQTFYLASEIQTGVSYLIVSGKYAMALDGTTIKSDEVTGNAGDATIQLPASTVATLFIAAEKVVNYEGSNPAGHYTLSNGSNYLYRASSGSTQTVSVGPLPNNPTKYYVWEYDGEYLYHISSSSNTFYLGYNSGWVFVYSNSKPNTYLYTTTRPLPSRNLSFPQATYTAQMGTSFTAPELGGVTTGVKYKSSDTGVATVDEDTGAVTLVAAGTTTITASADATDEYAAGSAQYTLTVSAAAGTEKYYVLVTSEPASWNGKYLIVNTAADGTGSAMNGTGTANVTISGGKILSTSTVDGYALTVTSAGEVHPNQLSGESLIAYDIQFNDNYYLFWFNNAFKYSENQQTGREGLTYYRCTLKYDNGVRIMSAGYPLSEGYTPGKYYLYYQSSGSYTMSSSQSSSRVQLYKLDEGGDTPTPTPQPQSLNFPQAAYTTQMGTSFSAPTVSGAKTSVSYASSNESVATVNATSGAVTLVAAGETTITASAPAGTVNGVSYLAGSAQYTLTVSEGTTPSGTKYMKVTSMDDIEVGAKYLLVCETSSKVFYPYVNSPSATNFQKATGNALDVTITNNTIISDSFDDCQITLESGYYFFVDSAEMYLYPSSGSTLSAEKTASHKLTISFSNGIASAKNGNYAVYYSTNSSWFSTSNSTFNTTLYKLIDERLAQNMTFSRTSAEYDLGTNSWDGSIPTVSGNQTSPVTYESSNTSVATVAADGTVIPRAKGTAIITATAPANDTYKKGVASYTLTVSNSASTEKTYKYTSTISEGTYLLGGSEGSTNTTYYVALFPAVTKDWTDSQGRSNSGEVLNHQQINEAETFTTDDEAIFNSEIELIASGNGWKIQVKATGQYFSTPSANYQISLTDDVNSAAVYTIQSNRASAGSYYIYHSGSAAGFTQRNSSTTNLRFYMLSE